MKVIVLFLLFQGLQVKVLGNVGTITTVVGYVGESIVLPGKPPESWILVRIDWAIMYNHTWIATWSENGLNTERRPEYKGRLSLDLKSADLTIRDLRLRDAMTYTVDLINATNFSHINKVNLIVKLRLKKPTLQLYQNFTKSESGCVLVLNCSSPDTGVTFFWEVEPSCHHCSNSSSNNTSELIAFFLTTPDSVNLTCIVKRELQTASSILISKMRVPRFVPQQDCSYMFAWGFFATMLIVIVVVVIFHFRDKITKMFQFGGPGILSSQSEVQQRA